MSKPFLRQRVRDVAGRDRSEQLIVLAGAALERNRNAFELLGQLFRLRLLLGGAAHRRRLHLLDDRLVARRSLNRQLARQQIIASIAFRNFHHVAARPSLCTSSFRMTSMMTPFEMFFGHGRHADLSGSVSCLN